jgi:hypothetical protein
VVAGVRAANRLSPIPSVDHARKSIVLAIRGTASLSDAITDICVAPEDVSKWIPADVKAKLPPGAPLLSHAGIVRAAEAVLADVDAMGVLPALLEGDRSLLCAFSQNLDAGKRDSLAKQASGVLREVATAAIDPARLAAVCDASLPDTKGWRLVVTGHSLGAGAAWDLSRNDEARRLLSSVASAGGGAAAAGDGVRALRDARRIPAGAPATGPTNAETDAAGLAALIPYLVESRLRDRGALFVPPPVAGAPFALVTGRVVCGANDASAGEAARKAVGVLTGGVAAA